jgi:uncharacterized protein YndB with AHSA1/START domain
MSLIDKTDASQSDTITFEFDLQHSPAKLWRAITDPALLSQWLLPVFDLKLEKGAAFTLKTQAYPPWDGTVDCRILEIEAQKKISYAWVVGAMHLDTVVTFVLTPTAAGTHLVVTQSGFKPEQKQNFGGARYGWKMMGGKLVELLAKTA